jgi:peptidoglycan/LPS O-acetylase OafA/YrhL
VPVIFYHFKFGCPGGFVGVDVFFVISGFLICSLILREQEAGVFSLAGFWERRVRRIFPALAVTVFASTLGGWLFFSDEDFCKLGVSVACQALLLSNVYFYDQSLTGAGYFAIDTATRPLLHTWSLAVEEQFYLFFPVLLLLFARFRTPAVRAVALIGLGSLILSVYQADSFATRTAAFYLLPARAWELLLGAMLAMLSGRIAAGQRIRETAGWAGVILIGLAILFYNKRNPFPGAAALPPCLGAALIIFSSETRLSQVGQILSRKPIVFVGLISYSLYLWHWPLLVFSQGLTLHPDGVLLRAVMIGGSTLLAILSWRFVETPFRKRRVLAGRTQILAFGVAATAMLVTLGVFISHAQGTMWRMNERFVRYANSRSHGTTRGMVPFDQALAGRFTPIGTRQTNAPLDVLIWGDSHALAMMPVLDELCVQRSRNAALACFPSTPPVLAGGQYAGAKFGFDGKTYDIARVVLDFITKTRPKIVIITAGWGLYPVTDSYKTQLLGTIHEVLGSGAKVYVLKDVPGPNFDAPQVVAITALYGGDLKSLGLTPAQLEAETQNMAGTFDQISQMGATVFDPARFFLNQEGIYCVVKDDQVLYMDGSHLTVEGARLLAPLFKPVIQAN